MKVFKKIAGVFAIIFGVLLVLVCLLFLAALVSVIIESIGYRNFKPFILLFPMLLVLFLSVMLIVFGCRLVKGKQKSTSEEMFPGEGTCFESSLSDTPPAELYASAPALVVASAVWCMACVFLLGFLIFSVCMYAANAFLYLYYPRSLTGIFLFATLPFSIVCGMVWGMLRGVVRVELTDTELRYTRGKKLQRTLPVTATLRTHVHKSMLLGLIPLSVDRTLRVMEATGKETVLHCKNFTAATFSLMTERLQALRGNLLAGKTPVPAAAGVFLSSPSGQLGTAPAPTAAPSLPDEFLLPRDQHLKAERKRLVQILGSLAGVGLVFSVIWFFTLGNARLTPNSLFLMLCIFLFYPLFGAIFYGTHYLRVAKKMAGHISLSPSGIAVDSTLYRTMDLIEVRATPSNYINVRGGLSCHRLLTFVAGNKRDIYQAGNTSASPGALVYDEYPLLLDALRTWCAANSVVFYVELE